MNSVENYERIKSEIGVKVTSVCVSKTVDKEVLKEFMERTGHSIFGENYVQELEIKSEYLPEARWHYIGKVQKSNVNRLLRIKNLEMIETVDSAEIAAFINNRLDTLLDVLVQVNFTQEPQKNGCEPTDLESILSFIRTDCKRLRVRGLMGMGREGFSLLKDLFEKYREEYGLDVLSMGMSGDYKEALLHGANNLRLGINIIYSVGSCIFGERNYN